MTIDINPTFSGQVDYCRPQQKTSATAVVPTAATHVDHLLRQFDRLDIGRCRGNALGRWAAMASVDQKRGFLFSHWHSDSIDPASLYHRRQPPRPDVNGPTARIALDENVRHRHRCRRAHGIKSLIGDVVVEDATADVIHRQHCRRRRRWRLRQPDHRYAMQAIVKTANWARTQRQRPIRLCCAWTMKLMSSPTRSGQRKLPKLQMLPKPLALLNRLHTKVIGPNQYWLLAKKDLGLFLLHVIREKSYNFS